ncbi:MAG: 16S rRNA (guanine(966)-N(2))-methyltransferase RsmD [Pseudomonadales bacterium]|uniref:SAM-dependent 16S rRNA m(2)G966 methyltransferase n=1 Tax=Oleiphilus messinensis TaxID=141451 RepID=A0A1Y0I1U0_9GAMM|nr:16S rRNA (guanine(966)-N(2))-methyltransferase RsmD [Oleiphilus messinensis]ARU54448.1 SAM-dependent 16S rRNA m(2)G966 methyltransferase [Oleiphilus messinensis]MCG8613886.1 16S rRNA (guanine(966)-N(2))-methyltransferase RsmD [Pseudomonadales bacterium]
MKNRRSKSHPPKPEGQRAHRSARRPAGTPTSSLRIIGGQYRGRRINFPDWDGLRPTPDRIRETLFNWLSFDIEGSTCMDLCAGTGILAFEALSRRAQYAKAIDQSRDSILSIQKNSELLSIKNLDCANNAIESYLSTHPDRRYNVVFMDPPFRKGMVIPAINLLEEKGWLAADAWVYIETEAELNALCTPDTWTLHREKTAGQVRYRLYRRQAPDLEASVSSETASE